MKLLLNVALVMCSFVGMSGHKMMMSLPPEYSKQMRNVSVMRCNHTESECEFVLVVKEWLTMYHGNQPVYLHEGNLFEYTMKNPNASTPGVMKEMVTSADGTFGQARKVFLYNGRFPGPTIEVYRGQKVTVHVTNSLLSETTTVHWHGLHMKNNQFADGAPHITQCPILPGQTFTYKFSIDQAPGTYWYHSHVGVQRSNGLCGPFIIKDRPVQNVNFPPEHVLMAQEWNHDMDPSMNFLKMFFGFYRGNPPNTMMWMGNKEIGGATNGMFDYQSGLINGRGRSYDVDTMEHNNAPLTDFEVTHGDMIRFRLINSASVHPFRISIDNHPLTIIASDGHFIEPIRAHSVIVSPGERYDVIITANQTIGNYWIRASTLEMNVNHTAEAVLRYTGGPMKTDPASSDFECTQTTPCNVLNCHFRYFPADRNQTCIYAADMRWSSEQEYHEYLQLLKTNLGSWPKTQKIKLPKPTKEMFLNFGFPGTKWAPGSINGRNFKHPHGTALTDFEDIHTLCDHDPKCGDDTVCTCTAVETINYGDEVQMVFTNHGSGSGFSHPVHIHGHHFRIVKIGFGHYDKDTGLNLKDNMDISCGAHHGHSMTTKAHGMLMSTTTMPGMSGSMPGMSGSMPGMSGSTPGHCNSPTWAHKTWMGGNVPDSSENLGPLKDTIVVPSGGYVVVRFTADNPGPWLLHCHVDVHSSDGMMVLLAEAPDRWLEPPPGFPRCGNYDLADEHEETGDHGDDDSHSDKSPLSASSFSASTFWIVVGCLAFVCFVLLLSLICTCCRLRNSGSSETRKSYPL